MCRRWPLIDLHQKHLDVVCKPYLFVALASQAEDAVDPFAASPAPFVFSPAAGQPAKTSTVMKDVTSRPTPPVVVRAQPLPMIFGQAPGTASASCVGALPSTLSSHCYRHHPACRGQTAAASRTRGKALDAAGPCARPASAGRAASSACAVATAFATTSASCNPAISSHSADCTNSDIGSISQKPQRWNSRDGGWRLGSSDRKLYCLSAERQQEPAGDVAGTAFQPRCSNLWGHTQLSMPICC